MSDIGAGSDLFFMGFCSMEGITANKTKINAVVQLALIDIRNAAKVLDALLASRNFVVGDFLPLADIDIAAPVSQYNYSGAPFMDASLC